MQDRIRQKIANTTDNMLDVEIGNMLDDKIDDTLEVKTDNS